MNRSGEGGEEPVLRDPGSEFDYDREKKRAKTTNRMKKKTINFVVSRTGSLVCCVWYFF